jgi:uncharacterized protein YecT (DUF1311 family)
MHAMRRALTAAAASICLLTPVAHAGDQGDPSQSCDGSTYDMVECLKSKTAQWDKRMNVAYPQALTDAMPQQREQLRAAQRLWIQYRDAIACITAWARVPSPGSTPANACAA